MLKPKSDDTLTGDDREGAFFASRHAGDDVIRDHKAGVDRIEINEDAEVEVTEGENGVEIIIQGKDEGVLTVEGVLDVHLMPMG